MGIWKKIFGNEDKKRNGRRKQHQFVDLSDDWANQLSFIPHSPSHGPPHPLIPGAQPNPPNVAVFPPQVPPATRDPRASMPPMGTPSQSFTHSRTSSMPGEPLTTVRPLPQTPLLVQNPATSIYTRKPKICPIDEIPTEILQDIFQHVIPYPRKRDVPGKHDNLPNTADAPDNNAPFVLAQVSRLWRSTALSLSVIWSYFCIADWTDAREIDYFLEQSNNKPLYVYVACTFGGPISGKWLDMLEDDIERIQCLILEHSPLGFPTFEGEIVPCMGLDLPRICGGHLWWNSLQEFSMLPRNFDNIDRLLESVLHHAPLLRVFNIHDVPFPFNALAASALSNVVELCLMWSESAEMLMRTLQCTPKVRTLSLGQTAQDGPNYITSIASLGKKVKIPESVDSLTLGNRTLRLLSHLTVSRPYPRSGVNPKPFHLGIHPWAPDRSPLDGFKEAFTSFFSELSPPSPHDPGIFRIRLRNNAIQCCCDFEVTILYISPTTGVDVEFILHDPEQDHIQRDLALFGRRPHSVFRLITTLRLALEGCDLSDSQYRRLPYLFPDLQTIEVSCQSQSISNLLLGKSVNGQHPIIPFPRLQTLSVDNPSLTSWEPHFSQILQDLGRRASHGFQVDRLILRGPTNLIVGKYRMDFILGTSRVKSLFFIPSNDKFGPTQFQNNLKATSRNLFELIPSES